MRRLLLLAILGLACGCASPTYVIEDSELPLFLGDGDLLTARRGSQEVNVRHVREDKARLQRTWLDPLSPDERSFSFDPTWGRILSVGRQTKGENPLRSGSPYQRDRVEAGLFAPDTVFSLRSWPGGDELVSRKSHPGLAQTPDGNLVLRSSREARFELYDTASGAVVSSGPALEEASPAVSAGQTPRLSAACFTGPRSFAYAWEGEVFLGELEGRRCSVERLSRGSSMALHEGRLYVLVKNRWLRAFDLETRRPLWQVELAELGLVPEAPEQGRPWRLQLSPDGGAISVEGAAALLVVETRTGRAMLGPYSPPAGTSLESLSLGNRRCAALYTFEGSGQLRSYARAWDYGPKQQEVTLLEVIGDLDEPLQAIALSADGQWLALSAGADVQVWRIE